MMSKIALFLDTNVFLHYRRLDEIDWLGITKAQSIAIVIPSIVIRELNKQKELHSAPRIRKRAQGILSFLEEVIDAVPQSKMRSNVEILFVSEEPLINYADQKLDFHLADDVLIAAILVYRDQNKDTNCALVTADVGLKLKARSHQIAVVPLPDKLKLAEEEGPAERRVRELETENRALRSQIPKLSLGFSKGAPITRIRLTQTDKFDENAARSKIAELRLAFPPFERPHIDPEANKKMTIGDLLRSPGKRSELTINPLALVKEEEIEKYNKNLESFFSQSLSHLRLLHEFESANRLTAALRISVTNQGTCPAEEIVVAMHFPDGFRLRQRDEAPTKPIAPTPPEKPFPFGGLKNYAQMMSYGQSFAGLDLPHIVAQNTSNVSAAKIKLTKSYDVEIRVRKLNHGFSQSLEVLFAEFASFNAASSFKITYKLHAANLPDPATGELHVVVEKAAK